MLRNLRKQGITIIVSTPIMDEARQCDRIAFINHGQVHGIDTPERILQKFASILCPPPLEREEAQQMAAPVIEVEQLTKSFGHLRQSIISLFKCSGEKFSVFLEPMEQVRRLRCVCFAD